MSRSPKGVSWKMPSVTARRRTVAFCAEDIAAIARIREEHPECVCDADAIRFGLHQVRRTTAWERAFRTVGVMYLTAPLPTGEGGAMVTVSVVDGVRIEWERVGADGVTRVLSLVFAEDGVRYTRKWREGVQAADIVRTDDHLRDLWRWFVESGG